MSRENQDLIASVGSEKHELAIARLLRDNHSKSRPNGSIGRIPPDRKVRMVLELPSGELAASLLMLYAEARELKEMLGGVSIPVMGDDRLVLATTQSCSIGHKMPYLTLLRFIVIRLARTRCIQGRAFDQVVSLDHDMHLPDQGDLEKVGYEVYRNPGSLVTTSLRREYFDTASISIEADLLFEDLPNWRLEGNLPFFL